MDSLITIVAPIGASQIPVADALLDALANPAAHDMGEAIDAQIRGDEGIHFMSLHAIPSADGATGHIVLEFTADGDGPSAIQRIVKAIGTALKEIFSLAEDWRPHGDLAAYLKARQVKVGQGLFDPPGVLFAGTPGLTVGRIRKEAALASFVAKLVDGGAPDLQPIDRLAEIRAKVRGDARYQWALEPPPPPPREARDWSLWQQITALAGPFARTYLWPAGLVLLAGFLIPLLVGHGLVRAFGVAGWTLLGLIAIIAIALVAAYAALRRQEEEDWTDNRAPDAAILHAIGERENFCAQNHMISVTRRKPGAVRWLTIRLAFWIIGMLAKEEFQPGFLGSISTIHAARWFTIPGTRTLVFLSNYSGSWESYLEDFITRAHAGLTAIWSNTIGFPRTRNLVQGGATDGERFKRFARASMRPTRFWYSAYPDLTTDHVRRNALMRRGLSAALTNDEAKEWLALFGSVPRPDVKLESCEIQSLVFGGLGFFPCGACLLYTLPDDEAAGRGFVAALLENVAFGDGRKVKNNALITVALGAGALVKLGLPQECVSTFPPAFLEGMATKTRARILGDTANNGPENWEWGRETNDIALLVYGRDMEAVSVLERKIGEQAAKSGMPLASQIPLLPVKKPAIEPFGFVDGISQPVIRGSYQSFRKNDPIHTVQPGEFILGYPDDRGNFPPEPILSPLHDPDNRLPVADQTRAFGNSIVDAPRAIARNGTFLVIRQLEQDVDSFWSYCRQEAARLSNRLSEPYEVTPEFIAAKLVGRWPDGSSLLRNPYYPFPKEEEERKARRARRETAKGFSDESAIAAMGEPVGSGTGRPDIKSGHLPAVPSASAHGHHGDNDFLYGVEDPQALRCPFGAHVRRANPRDSLAPGSVEQIAISNRHRILRVGRLYQPKVGKAGLLFMCLNGDIERQFEFVQQTWLNNPGFHGLTDQKDPLIGQGGVGHLVPSHHGPVRLSPLSQFVKTLGGGYFFMPSRSMLEFLGKPPKAAKRGQNLPLRGEC